MSTSNSAGREQATATSQTAQPSFGPSGQVADMSEFIAQRHNSKSELFEQTRHRMNAERESCERDLLLCESRAKLLNTSLSELRQRLLAYRDGFDEMISSFGGHDRSLAGMANIQEGIQSIRHLTEQAVARLDRYLFENEMQILKEKEDIARLNAITDHDVYNRIGKEINEHIILLGKFAIVCISPDRMPANVFVGSEAEQALRETVAMTRAAIARQQGLPANPRQTRAEVSDAPDVQDLEEVGRS